MATYHLVIIFIILITMEASADNKEETTKKTTTTEMPRIDYHGKPETHRSQDQENVFLWWLFNGCWNSWRREDCNQSVPDQNPPEYPGFDGWYNNVAHPEQGAKGMPLTRHVPPSYEDGVYKPAGHKRPNALTLSLQLMKEYRNIAASTTHHTAFMVFLGQWALAEIVDTRKQTCPPEYMDVPIPKEHPYKLMDPKLSFMSFERTEYDRNTGYSPNNPRQQLNQATPYIDGGTVYGTSKAWSDKLRRQKDGSDWKTVPNGLLASTNEGRFPPLNSESQLPMVNPSLQYHQRIHSSLELSDEKKLFLLGNPRGNENPFLLAFSIVWFRWHNIIATNLHKLRPGWDSEKVFSEARKWVIATQQHIIINRWLPNWLGDKLPKYGGYNPHIDPQIEQAFEVAAMRYGHTFLPKGVPFRDYARNGCSYSNKSWTHPILWTCSTSWNSLDYVMANYSTTEYMDIDGLLMGLASYRAEEKDNEGSKNDSPQSSEIDMMALNIQRGRDHGVPDYNRVRKYAGLKDIQSLKCSSQDQEKNPICKRLYLLKEMYNGSLSDIDLWVGGLLESDGKPGELFTTIIKDQFMRIRDGDRFWYANYNNGLFTKEEVRRIENITIYDILMSVTKMEMGDIQLRPFLGCGLKSERHSNCHSKLEEVKCRSTHTLKTESCYFLPVIKVDNNGNCSEPIKFDYSQESVVTLTLTILGIAILIGGAFIVLLLLIWNAARKASQKHVLYDRIYEYHGEMDDKNSFFVEEWVGKKEPHRRMVLMLDTPRKQIQIWSRRGAMLRAMDVSHTTCLDLFVITDNTYILLRVSNNYDLVAKFDSENERQRFLNLLETFVDNLNISRERVSMRWKPALNQVITKADRQKKLEMFFRVVFSQAFKIPHSEEEILKLDANAAREVVYTELTVTEFADALSMKPDSEFICKIFSAVDKDKNGFISFREFLDTMIIFAKGSTDEKAQLLFDMYDINGTGLLTREDFINMVKSLMDTVSAELEDKKIRNVITSMMNSAGFDKKDRMDRMDFQKLLSEYKSIIGCEGLNIAEFTAQSKLKKLQIDPSEQVSQENQSAAEAVYSTVYECLVDPRQPLPRSESIIDQNQREVLQYENCKPMENKFIRRMKSFENNSKLIFWTMLYTLVLFGIVAERCYCYTVESEHFGLRRIAGYALVAAMSASSAMLFAYTSVLLTSCRNSIMHLRETFLYKYIPFESSSFLHKYIACWAFFFTGIHVVGHAVTFFQLSTRTSDELSCIFQNCLYPTASQPPSHWFWGTVTGITGVPLTILVAIIGIFSLPMAREKVNPAFQVIHAFYPLIYILMAIHSLERLIQEPYFPSFFLVPAIIFMLDQVISFSRKNVEIPVFKAELLPSNVTMLEFKKPNNFQYRSGNRVRIACPAISKSEFYPFSLTSAPYEPNLQIHIHQPAAWNAQIRNLCDPDGMEELLPKLYLDGPYGGDHQDWYQHEVSILISGGMGVAPFASILKDIVYRSNMKLESTCKKVYFVWITKTQRQFEWMINILRELEKSDSSNMVSVHLFITEFYHKYDLRTSLLYICERHFQRICGHSLFTGLTAVTHFGRPNLLKLFGSLQHLHAQTGIIGVFTSGPPLLSSAVDEACLSANRSTLSGPIFRHHSKNI